MTTEPASIDPETPPPAVGLIVHYVSYGTPGGEYTSQCRAAIITGVLGEANEDGACVSLAVLNPTGLFFDTHICQNEADHKGGTWHYPEGITHLIHWPEEGDHA